MADEKKYLDSSGLIRLVANVIAKLNGKSDSSHNHDDKYSKTNHTHDDRYYTEDEVDEKISGITSGTIVVKEAEHAESADTATNATTATTATNANHATTADSATSATTATSATKATQDGNGKVIADTYQTIANATSQHNALQSSIDAKVPTSRTINGKALTANITLSASDVGAATTAYVDAAESDANEYTDNAIANLLNNSTEAVDSIYELRDAMETNADAIEALQSIAAGKADASHTHDDRYYTESEIDSKVSDLEDAISGKADSSHTHTIANITNLQSTLDGKAASNHTHIYYGVCETAADTVAKTVTVPNFTLETGAMVIVKFTNASGVASPTLNVSSTGAKPIYRYGTTAASTGTSTTGWRAGAVQIFVYDGTGWVRDFWENSTYSNASLGQGYTTCSTAAATKAKTASLSSYSLTTGGIVSVKFTYDVPAGATLNVNSKGAKAIYYNGAAITADVIKAGDTATFIYSSQYHLIAINRNACTKAEFDALESRVDTNESSISSVQDSIDDINAAIVAITNDEIDAICGASIAYASNEEF